MNDNKLYYLRHTTENGDSVDHFVTATSPEQAVALWRQSFEMEKSDCAGVIPVPSVADEPQAHAWAEWQWFPHEPETTMK